MNGRLTLGVLALAGFAAAQDSIQLRDTRFVLDKEMTRNLDGVIVHFDNGDVFIANDKILTTTAHAEGIADAALSEEDKEKIAEGMVLFEGRWVSQRTADRRVADLRKAREKMIVDAKEHQKWRNRYTERTRNFEFEYTIDPVIMQEYMDLMETYYTYFTKEWGIRKPRGVDRLKVCFYHDEEYFHQVSGAPGGAAGYFRFVDPIELNFYFDRMEPDFTIDVMFHEANHFLTYLISPQFKYPSWINESLAEYYGASEWDPENKKMSVGGIQEGRLAVIQDEVGLNRAVSASGTISVDANDTSWQDLEELLSLPQNRFTSLHYAWGWSFIHFLFHGEGGKYERNFKRFYKALPSDRKIPKVPFSFGMVQVKPEEQITALKRYLKVNDLEDLEKQWHAYVRQLDAVGPRGKLRAGRIALMDEMPIKATRLLNEAVEAGSTNPLTWYYLGQTHYRQGKYAEAYEALEKVAEMDPLNGLVYLRMAQCKERMGKKDDPEVARLRRLAAEVDPDNYSVFLEVGLAEGQGDSKK